MIEAGLCNNACLQSIQIQRRQYRSPHSRSMDEHICGCRPTPCHKSRIGRCRAFQLTRQQNGVRECRPFTWGDCTLSHHCHYLDTVHAAIELASRQSRQFRRSPATAVAASRDTARSAQPRKDDAGENASVHSDAASAVRFEGPRLRAREQVLMIEHGRTLSN
jgi:hypothetical protein